MKHYVIIETKTNKIINLVYTDSKPLNALGYEVIEITERTFNEIAYNNQPQSKQGSSNAILLFIGGIIQGQNNEKTSPKTKTKAI